MSRPQRMTNVSSNSSVPSYNTSDRAPMNTTSTKMNIRTRHYPRASKAKVFRKRNWREMTSPNGEDIPGDDSYSDSDNNEESSEHNAVTTVRDEEEARSTSTTTYTDPLTFDFQAASSDAAVGDSDDGSDDNDTYMSKTIPDRNGRSKKIVRDAEDEAYEDDVKLERLDEHSVLEKGESDTEVFEGTFAKRPRRNEEGKWICYGDGCVRQWKDKSDWKRHYSAVHLKKRYYCQYEDCDKSYSLQNALDYHVVHAHGKGGFDCPVRNCRFKCATKALLVLHRSDVHESQRFKCTHEGCERKFTSMRRMQYHAKCVHKPVSYPCPEEDCDAVFKGANGLRKHRLNKHEGVRYQCEERNCAYSSAAKENLSRHVRTVHKQKQ